ncbi:MAG TPA: hypothetical protein VMW62_16205 [Chloroflexota bacterium]|nr:hypothetical protein [Chloroflexota bacterium]
MSVEPEPEPVGKYQGHEHSKEWVDAERHYEDHGDNEEAHQERAASEAGPGTFSG